MSVISAMELFYGAFNKVELRKLKKFIELFHVIPLDEKTSNIAVNLVYEYAKSHALDIPDSLIAATAINAKLPLLSYNKKDFRFIEDLNLTK